jgi:hypothetical protein
MKPAAIDLTRAILTELHSKDLPVGKTKLLKLLYVADLEHFRATGETWTGFEWIFFLYGPWAGEYDEVLAQLEAMALIARRPWAAGGLEGEEIRVQEPLELGAVIKDTAEYFYTRRLIDSLGELSTSEVLDWVYFRTEPMQGAEKMKPLDFGKVAKEQPRFYQRTRSAPDRDKIRALRQQFQQVRHRLEQETRDALSRFKEPTFDDAYIRALDVMNSEGAE